MSLAAGPLTLRPRFFEMFSTAMVNATRNTNAWVVSGGMDTGVMKLIGDALSKFQSTDKTIGISPWGVVHGRTRLQAEGVQHQYLPTCTVRVDGLAGR
jgi:transient receptor potential cation channel subfamily M protein 3